MIALHYIIDGLLVGLATLSVIGVAYLLLLTGAAATYRRRQSSHTPSGRRYAILVPAHNEEETIAALLESLNHLAYPKDHFSINVVADNCTDKTAELARRSGANTFERADTTSVGKGFALDWLLTRVCSADEPDVIVYMDADAIAPPNLLSAFDVLFDDGQRAVQAHYAVGDPFASWATTMRAAAMLLVNFVRPLGRLQLGLSAGLKGTGMAISTPIAKANHWGGSLAEDTEYHARLLLQGIKVAFAPDATVTARMPSTLSGSVDQNRRWEAGRMGAARSLGPSLLRSGIMTGSAARIDAALDLIVPPLSTLAALIVAGLCVGALLSPTAMWMFAIAAAGLCVHVVAGLFVSRAETAYYVALLRTPAFVIWKLRVYAGALRRGPQAWVRTTREPKETKGRFLAKGAPSGPRSVDRDHGSDD